MGTVERVVETRGLTQQLGCFSLCQRLDTVLRAALGVASVASKQKISEKNLLFNRFAESKEEISDKKLFTFYKKILIVNLS